MRDNAHFCAELQLYVLRTGVRQEFRVTLRHFSTTQ